MKLKDYIFTTFLLAIGLILHQITPGIFGGMKFDFLLIFMFVAIFINTKFKNVILTGLLGGLLSAMTTSFPGGQLPNILDKIVTCLVVFVLIRLFKNNYQNIFIVGLIGGIGTFVSGMTFVVSAAFIVGLPAPMKVLVTGIVIPTALINILGTVFVYRLVNKSLKFRYSL
ncbi:MAG: tryptophan transporter [Tissierellia bacterium]|nr:tryptophan transporter [Tissierellia bacterium]